MATDLHTFPSGPVPVADDALLDEVAALAADLVRPDLQCGITLREFRSVRIAGSSDVSARRCEAVQQAERFGPGLTALEENRVVVVAHTGRTRRWPAWRDAAVHEGFRTAVALPTPVGRGVDAAVVLYDAAPAPWERGELRRAAAFVRQVARVAALEMEVGRLHCLTEELFAGVSARDAIGQATGIVMAQRSCGPEEALGVLRRAAEHRGVQLRDLAAMIISEVARADTIRSSMFDESPAPREVVGTRARQLP
ncbi:GAF and ANTAR domain-containing protein [uncultured Cellulomonas sp.]|uniref:GAF and ANTAR domain-containing protein n=1 Tax=uncultured Cellulomonas sp. TaxID=189682 RepID=UPI002614A884|nr:GAF and ANTAR domain-containing protein [uncultured Cellulomonas sp.]